MDEFYDYGDYGSHQQHDQQHQKLQHDLMGNVEEEGEEEHYEAIGRSHRRQSVQQQQQYLQQQHQNKLQQKEDFFLLAQEEHQFQQQQEDLLLMEDEDLEEEYEEEEHRSISQNITQEPNELQKAQAEHAQFFNQDQQQTQAQANEMSNNIDDEKQQRYNREYQKQMSYLSSLENEDEDYVSEADDDYIDLGEDQEYQQHEHQQQKQRYNEQYIDDHQQYYQQQDQSDRIPSHNADKLQPSYQQNQEELHQQGYASLASFSSKQEQQEYNYEEEKLEQNNQDIKLLEKQTEQLQCFYQDQMSQQVQPENHQLQQAPDEHEQNFNLVEPPRATRNISMDHLQVQKAHAELDQYFSQDQQQTQAQLNVMSNSNDTEKKRRQNRIYKKQLSYISRLEEEDEDYESEEQEYNYQEEQLEQNDQDIKLLEKQTEQLQYFYQDQMSQQVQPENHQLQQAPDEHEQNFNLVEPPRATHRNISMDHLQVQKAHAELDQYFSQDQQQTQAQLNVMSNSNDAEKKRRQNRIYKKQLSYISRLEEEDEDYESEEQEYNYQEEQLEQNDQDIKLLEKQTEQLQCFYQDQMSQQVQPENHQLQQAPDEHEQNFNLVEPPRATHRNISMDHLQAQKAHAEHEQYFSQDQQQTQAQLNVMSNNNDAEKKKKQLSYISQLEEEDNDYKSEEDDDYIDQGENDEEDYAIDDYEDEDIDVLLPKEERFVALRHQEKQDQDHSIYAIAPEDDEMDVIEDEEINPFIDSDHVVDYNFDHTDYSKYDEKNYDADESDFMESQQESNSPSDENDPRVQARALLERIGSVTKSTYRRMNMEFGNGKSIGTRTNELAHLHEQDEQEHMPQKRFAAAMGVVPPSAVFSRLPLDDDVLDDAEEGGGHHRKESSKLALSTTIWKNRYQVCKYEFMNGVYSIILFKEQISEQVIGLMRHVKATRFYQEYCSFRKFQLLVISVSVLMLTTLMVFLVEVSNGSNNGNNFESLPPPLQPIVAAALYNGSSIPLAPHNLATICTVKKILRSAVGYQTCATTCALSNCCRSQDNNCLDTIHFHGRDVCEGYESCFVLKFYDNDKKHDQQNENEKEGNDDNNDSNEISMNTVMIVPPLPFRTLDKLCSITSLNSTAESKSATKTSTASASSAINKDDQHAYELCTNVCYFAQCCTASKSNNCYATNIEACNAYHNHCQNLLLHGHPPFSEISSTATIAAIPTISREELSNPYSPIKLHFEPEKFCRKEYVVLYGIEGCEMACSQRYCCITANEKQSCRGLGEHNNSRSDASDGSGNARGWCTSYEICKIALTRSDAASFMESSPKNTSLVPAKNDTISVSRNGTSDYEEKMMPPLPSMLPELCSSSSVQTSHGFLMCATLCQTAQCCTAAPTMVEAGTFIPSQNNGDGNCYPQNPNECNAYHKHCVNMVNFGIIPKNNPSTLYVDESLLAGVYTPQLPQYSKRQYNLNTICSRSYINVKGSQDCDVKCQSRSCCFTTAISSSFNSSSDTRSSHIENKEVLSQNTTGDFEVVDGKEGDCSSLGNGRWCIDYTNTCHEFYHVLSMPTTYQEDSSTLSAAALSKSMPLTSKLEMIPVAQPVSRPITAKPASSSSTMQLVTTTSLPTPKATKASQPPTKIPTTAMLPTNSPKNKNEEVEKNLVVLKKKSEDSIKGGNGGYNPEKAVSEQLVNICSMDIFLQTEAISQSNQLLQKTHSLSMKKTSIDIDSKISQLTIKQCRDRCEPAICCFTPVASLNCVQDYQLFCEDYAVCRDVFTVVLDGQQLYLHGEKKQQESP
eukprot:CAMPEP_0194445950 /NCGR_PEP_ID=MMETSP0176-20130528/128156_1 /TAXON_ID=216777 /ORGANISM="Proboscia alata, Strain PI-D3" /LENGTH=1778 /DNA_ID=CAMNT_0039272583 /DNA_START=183 /DNA_END=5519 /DNA_ORIENTATION=+